MKLDPTVFSDAACHLAVDRDDHMAGAERGMCTAIARELGLRGYIAMADSIPFSSLLEQYFKPWPANAYWWPDVSEQSQAERFMALHFMALIAEDLE